MKFILEPDITPLAKPLRYTDHILLTGSCFTEHISDRLAQHKFRVLSNPNGILFNPLSVADSLNGYMDGRVYTEQDLFYGNELWNSWDHHTRFSDTDKQKALQRINEAQHEAAVFIRRADQLLITLGSAFQYYLKDQGRPVSNNHRAPGQWFEKRLLDIEVITDALSGMLDRLLAVNPAIQVLLTISPVRHIRDGVTDNNRSKARLIESVHRLCSRYTQLHYFPAYELMIDILRDYRFYDIDLVHPNYQATSFVWEQFVTACIDSAEHGLMKQLSEISTARSHRPRFPGTEAHAGFCRKYLDKIKMLQEQYPYLDLRADLDYFEQLTAK
jgi:hypothetical protein